MSHSQDCVYKKDNFSYCLSTFYLNTGLNYRYLFAITTILLCVDGVLCAVQ